MNDFSKDNLKNRLGNINQLASVRRSILDDGKGRGMRIFDVRNASGLSFTVFPDKGLDIGPTDFNGLPIAWISPNGAVAPSFYNPTGLEWLRSWSAGLLTTCGLLNAGGPCTPPDGPQGLHGRHHHTPAEEVNSSCKWLPDGRYQMEITGTICHSKVFGEKLAVRRTIRTFLGSPSVELIDSTENLGSSSQPFMQLYHMNFGWPLMHDDTTLLSLPHDVIPQNDFCRKNLEDWNRFSEPKPNIPEQVFYHDLPADNKGLCNITIDSPKTNLFVKLSFRKAELPYLIQWKMPGTCEYVMGLEPANCYPEGRLANESRGILRHIEPGQIIDTYLRLSISSRSTSLS